MDASRVGAEEASRLLREAVQGARAAGHSWDTVGRVLGVSRQAAQQRFAGKAATASAPSAGGPDAPGRRTLSGLTAFNEMAALEEAGRDGWHMVGYGPFFHEVEASGHPWEHCRITLPSLARHRRMESEGWIPVGAGWFPWRYYKRPVDPGTKAPCLVGVLWVGPDQARTRAIRAGRRRARYGHDGVGGEGVGVRVPRLRERNVTDFPAPALASSS
ncbi:hypothetical protein [Streptomyces sp. NPDC085540]|uniref:hypothetical protein n=1 Tax=Streptomyces sp. NPDC085540 TaxID=3365730 RepID=UPI0037D043FA